jgi:3-dehydroquinate dehydratase-2
LNRLGKREPEIYRRRSPKSKRCAAKPRVDTQSSFAVECRTQLIDWIHEAIDLGSGILINPAAYSFTSIAILDALKMFPGPVFELHISNVHRREAIYHNSLVSQVATAVLMGLGPDGYPTAVAAMVRLLDASGSSAART